MLENLPQVSVQPVSKGLSMSKSAARIALNYMVQLGMLEKISGKQRDKIYVYRKYLDSLESGANPL